MGHTANLRNRFKSITKTVWAKLLLYHNVDEKRKKPVIFFWEMIVPLLKFLESPSPQDALFQIWLTLAQWFWIFLNLNNVFRYYTPLEKPWSFICRNPMLLHPKKMCAKFGWNQLGGYGEKRFWKSPLLCYYLALQKSSCSGEKDWKWHQWFRSSWENFKKIRQCIFTFS